MPFCPECNTEVSENTKFCTECGAPVAQNKPNPEKAEENAISIKIDEKELAQEMELEKSSPQENIQFEQSEPTVFIEQSAPAAPNFSSSSESENSKQPVLTLEPPIFDQHMQSPPPAAEPQPQQIQQPQQQQQPVFNPPPQQQQQPQQQQFRQTQQQNTASSVPLSPPPAPPANQPQPGSEQKPPYGTRYSVMGVGSYIGSTIVISIPVIGWLFCLIWAFAAKNQNKRNYMRMVLIFWLVALIIGVGIYFLGYLLFQTFSGEISKWFQDIADEVIKVAT